MDIKKLFTFLVWLLVFGLIIYVAIWLLGMLGLSGPLHTIIVAVLALAGLIFVLRQLELI